MKSLIFIFFLFTFLFQFSKQFAVIGYIPEYRQNNIDWKAISPHLTHAILFSLEVTASGEITALDRFPNEQFMQNAKKYFQNKGGKLLVCLGGNARTNGFPFMVKTKNGREVFIKNLKHFLDKHNLDGVDLNWEYPENQEEWNGLFSLIAEMRKNFGQKKIITMAIYPGLEKKITNYIIDDLNYLLVMLYDRGCKKPPCHHSSFDFYKEYALNIRNIKKEKLALGLPFYARDGYNFKAETYSEIAKFGIDEKKDEILGRGSDFWMFNGVKTIGDKTKFALENNFGGVMIWELGQDLHPDNKLALLPAITKAIKKFNRSDEL